MARVWIRTGLRISILYLCTISSLSALPNDKNANPTKPEAPVEWIRKNAIPLQTVEAGHGFDDMIPLKSVIGDARIVALGEATHGSREFFQLKHRMVEFLATQMGFTIFSIEANMPEAYRLNEYVLHGTGDPKALLKGMYFWTWNTEEVLAMIQWMREFNQSGRGRVEFTGFDMQTPTMAMDIVRQYVKAHDASYLLTLEPIWQRVQTLTGNVAGFGVGSATFPIEAAVGKTVRFSGYIKTEDIKRGYAGLWWRVDGDSGPNGRPSTLALDNMEDRGAHGTTPWTRYEIKLQVPPNAKHINFGVLHTGDGTAWFDSLQVELDGVTYAEATPFDLDFESNPPRGFYTGGQGYSFTPDKSTVHSGSQSLRSAFGGASESRIDASILATQCREIVRELGKLQPVANADVSAVKEFEWVVQNARVVSQYAEMKAGKRSRDQSMADNVKWIAEQNPGAKIVIWAHNGHVSYRSVSFDPMGSYLHSEFGQKLINFGFALNEGSFQAIEPGKGLHDFVVGPAPEDSLDHALASTRMPLFALDLRNTPKTGLVAEWFHSSHLTRSVGSMYAAEAADRFFLQVVAPDTFDVLLFVEKTSAARKLAAVSSQ